MKLLLKICKTRWRKVYSTSDEFPLLIDLVLSYSRVSKPPCTWFTCVMKKSVIVFEYVRKKYSRI